MSSIRTFKMVALAEAASYLVLLAAAVVKRTHDVEALVPIVGPIHGLLFLAYLGLALYVRDRLGWNGWTTVMVVVASVLPLGGLVVERRIDDAPASAGEPSTPAPAG